MIVHHGEPFIWPQLLIRRSRQALPPLPRQLLFDTHTARGGFAADPIYREGLTATRRCSDTKVEDIRAVSGHAGLGTSEAGTRDPRAGRGHAGRGNS